MAELMPLQRSLTGPGTRATLEMIRREIPIDVHAVPSGASVFGWEVPDEWNLDRASLTDPDGRLVADTQEHALHVVGYSTPIRATVPLHQLDGHLHSLPDQPRVVPYRTSYYDPGWGFCLQHERRVGLPSGSYEVAITGTIAPGHLLFGELVVRGSSRSEVLVSTHVCHPQMANDNVTGIVAAIDLAQWALSASRRLTYRFLFIPATIGALAWLATTEAELQRIVHGLVIAGVGDEGPVTWKRPRRRESVIDRIMTELLTDIGRVIGWYPYGYDERQFCSPGIDLPVGRLSRSLHGSYPQYHTSADDLGFVNVGQVQSAIDLVVALFERLEVHDIPRNTAPFGEPRLRDVGLFPTTGGGLAEDAPEHAYLWVLSLADGTRDVSEIIAVSGLHRSAVESALDRLESVGLIER
jgi:aminopeptidase-like protein